MECSKASRAYLYANAGVLSRLHRTLSWLRGDATAERTDSIYFSTEVTCGILSVHTLGPSLVVSRTNHSG